MKTYLFILHYAENGRSKTSFHEEKFECDADAMMRAREILKEGKRDVSAFLIELHRKNAAGWLHVVSYQ